MHRAALAAAKSVLLAEDLQHHGVGIAALGDAVTMPPMGRRDHVMVAEMHAHADAGRLLTGIEMHEARDVSGGEFVVKRVLERADGGHPPIGFSQFLAAQLHMLPP